MNEHIKQPYQLPDIAQYEALIAAIPGGIVIVAADQDLTIRFASQGCCELIGYTMEEYVEKFRNAGAAIVHPDDVKEMVRSAAEQMDRTGAFNVKARLQHQHKGYIWAQFSGRRNVAPDGEARIYVVIVDISEHQSTVERLEQERSFNEQIAALSEEVYFDCDLLSGTMRHSQNFADKLGIDPVLSDYESMFLQLGLLSKDALEAQKRRFLHAKDGVIEDELQIRLPNGMDVWYLYRCNVMRDKDEKPIRVVGKFIDITRHKNQIDRLSELAQQDQLTGLYNKATTENLIKETLHLRRQHDDKFALMIIDLDNFKTVNDRLGHLYGDAVLTQLAEHLTALFRSDDIVGRVGGDEFFVFLKHYGTVELLTAKAEEICSLFHRTYSEGDAFVTISASIGIALCPEHGMTFDDLYQKSDAALYDAKARGKNTVSFYAESLAQSYLSTRTEIDTNVASKRFKDNRIEYVFKLLYDSENPAASIQAVLQLVTESFGFSRGYIFENSADGRFTSNTFEWCERGITAEMQNLQNIPMEGVATANRAFLQSGMLILKRVKDLPEIERNILEPQGIRSMFQFGIMSMGKLRGFIGFDDCASERIPSDREIDEICTVCHVLATFLLKHRSGEREVRHHVDIETVMNHINSYAYVIDPDQYTILYENQNVIKLTGSTSVGQRCHLAYRGRPEPCPDCPMAHLLRQDNRHVEEIYNEKYHFFMRVEVTLIDWSDNRKVCLLCGMDISEYRMRNEQKIRGILED